MYVFELIRFLFIGCVKKASRSLKLFLKLLYLLTMCFCWLLLSLEGVFFTLNTK